MMSFISRTVAGESAAGTVLGIAITEVNPPAAAAAVAVATHSFEVCPGSRKCACMSTNPGTSASPPASISTAESGAESANTPSLTNTSRTQSRFCDGSTTRAFLILSPFISRASRASRPCKVSSQPF